MPLLNSSLAGALGRPDLVWVAQGNQAYMGSPPTVVGGSSQSLTGGVNTLAGGGRFPLGLLIVAIVGYAAFTWWVRPHLA